MMYARATTTATVKRAGSVDEYSGELIDEVTVLTGVPISLIEQRRQVFDPVTGTPRTVHYCTARATANTDIQKNDTVTDEKTSTVYMVISTHQPQSAVHMQDLAMELGRIGTTTN